MKPGFLLRWSARLPHGLAVRHPAWRSLRRGRSQTAPTKAQVVADSLTLRQVVEGLNGLEERAERTDIVVAAEARGYLTPDEDDRVRQGLLAYRNYRLALYEIILRLAPYRRLRPASLRLRAFLVAFAAALTLYAKSLRLQHFASRSALVRAKLNEPEPKFDLEAGFFDEVMAGYSSLRNYGLILAASWFWLWRRRSIRRLARSEPEPWAWVQQLILDERRSLKTALTRVWHSRLEVGWLSLWRTLTAPAKRVQYRARAGLGEHFAGTWLQRDLHRPISGAELARLRAVLQPGDVLLLRAEGKLTASLLPGFWAHAAIYLGAVESHPASDGVEVGKDLPPAERSSPKEEGAGGHARREQERVPAGEGRADWVIEAVSPCVRMVSLEQCLDADHVLVLRPQLEPAARAAAIEEARCHLHKPYDFEFDFNLSSRVVCTGLVFRSFHGRGPIAFQLVKRLGNYTLTGDDLATQASETGGMKPVMLILRRGPDWRVEARPPQMAALLRAIRRGWRPLRSHYLP